MSEKKHNFRLARAAYLRPCYGNVVEVLTHKLCFRGEHPSLVNVESRIVEHVSKAIFEIGYSVLDSGMSWAFRDPDRTHLIIDGLIRYVLKDPSNFPYRVEIECMAYGIFHKGVKKLKEAYSKIRKSHYATAILVEFSMAKNNDQPVPPPSSKPDRKRRRTTNNCTN